VCFISYLSCLCVLVCLCVFVIRINVAKFIEGIENNLVFVTLKVFEEK